MTHLAIATGALTTNGVVRTGAGVLTYAEAGAGAVSLYDGLTTGANLIATLSSSKSRSFDCPVKFNAGLYITIGSGSAVVHTG